MENQPLSATQSVFIFIQKMKTNQITVFKLFEQMSRFERLIWYPQHLTCIKKNSWNLIGGAGTEQNKLIMTRWLQLLNQTG